MSRRTACDLLPSPGASPTRRPDNLKAHAMCQKRFEQAPQLKITHDASEISCNKGRSWPSVVCSLPSPKQVLAFKGKRLDISGQADVGVCTVSTGRHTAPATITKKRYHKVPSEKAHCLQAEPEDPKLLQSRCAWPLNHTP